MLNQNIGVDDNPNHCPGRRPRCGNFRVDFFHREFIGALFPGVLLDGRKPFRRSRHSAHTDLLSFGNGATEQAFNGQLLVG
jgi:hypothetical protein